MSSQAERDADQVANAIAQKARALAHFDCPQCGAIATHACVTPKGTPAYGVHVARFDLAAAK